MTKIPRSLRSLVFASLLLFGLADSTAASPLLRIPRDEGKAIDNFLTKAEGFCLAGGRTGIPRSQRKDRPPDR
jgi:hypothetical protein